MKYFKIVAFILSTICFTSIEAQRKPLVNPVDSASVGKLLKYDFKVALRGVENSFTQPTRWKKKDYLTMGSMFVGTFALSFIDEESSAYFVEIEPEVPSFIKNFGFYAGKPQYYFAATAGIYGFGLFTKNEKVRKTGVLIIAASVTTGVFQTFTKYAVGRARPTQNVGSTTFKPFTKESGYHSFPSGHTILSVTMAHSIAKQFDNTWAKVGIYTVGSIAPFSRLLEGAHWLTDVAFSTVISIVIVDGIDKFLFKTKSYEYPMKEKAISWNLKFRGNQIGFVGTF